MIDVIGKRKIFLGVSGLLVSASLILILVFGFRQGIDLVGGTEWRLRFFEKVDENSLNQVLKDIAGAANFSVLINNEEFVVRLHPLNEEEHQRYRLHLEEKFGQFEELSFSAIGPTIGRELRQRAVWAIILVLAGISLYIIFAFRKASREIKSWKYGLITMATLFHDVAIPAGLIVLLGVWKGVQIDTNFIVALLVVMGFSVHDTIVVFDRIREKLMINRNQKAVLADLINQSVNETLARSINTSLTLILVLAVMVFIGPPSLFYFVLTILVGTIVGTYSSIFVASPLLYLWRPKDLPK